LASSLQDLLSTRQDLGINAPALGLHVQDLVYQDLEHYIQDLGFNVQALVSTGQDLIRLDVESRLRKIRHGGKPWSLKLQIYRDTIELWDWAVKLKLGVKTSRTELKHGYNVQDLGI
jgi:hypothetical protein